MKKLNKILLVFLIIFFIATFLRFYKLDNQSFIADEYLGIAASYGYHKTQHWILWDFNNEQPTDESYSRANIYHWQVAKILDNLSLNEFNARFVSVIWGLIDIILVFIISFIMFRNAEISLLSSFFLAISISALTYDRKLRMYSMFAPLYFALSYCVYQFLESKPKHGIKFFEKIHNITKLNLIYIIPIVLIGYISFNTQILTLTIFPAIFIYLLAMLLIEYKKTRHWNLKYLSILICSAIIACIVILPNKIVNNKEIFSYFSLTNQHWSYFLKLVTDYSSGMLAGLFIILGAYYLIKNFGKSGLWFVISFLTPLALAVFVWQSVPGPQYIFYLTPFKVVLISAGIFFLSNFILSKTINKIGKLKILIYYIVSIFILINFSFFFSDDSFYANPKSWNYPNYRQAYNYYLKNKKDGDLLITRQLTSYYIKNSQSNLMIYNQDRNITLERLMEAQSNFNRIWFIASKDGDVKNDAMDYIEKNYQKIGTTYTNNNIMIWLWQK